MEELLTKLRNYSRFLELEDNLPYWETQIPELEDRIAEMKWNLDQKKQALLQLQEPNFFQRVFGRAEDKKETLTRQSREITAALRAAQQELQTLNQQIERGKLEVETLAGSWEAYVSAKAEAVLTPAQESRLMMEEITAFAPLALETAWRALTTLEEARPWIRSRRVITEDNRKLELLYQAQDQCKRLLNILAALPEGAATPGASLKSPYDYICGVTSEYQQMDRLETVQLQLRELRNQLKLLLGE